MFSSSTSDVLIALYGFIMYGPCKVQIQNPSLLTQRSLLPVQSVLPGFLLRGIVRPPNPRLPGGLPRCFLPLMVITTGIPLSSISTQAWVLGRALMRMLSCRSLKTGSRSVMFTGESVPIGIWNDMGYVSRDAEGLLLDAIGPACAQPMRDSAPYSGQAGTTSLQGGRAAAVSFSLASPVCPASERGTRASLWQETFSKPSLETPLKAKPVKHADDSSVGRAIQAKTVSHPKTLYRAPVKPVTRAARSSL